MITRLKKNYNALDQEIKDIYEKFLKNPVKIFFTDKDKKKYHEETQCHICEGAEGDFITDNKQKDYEKIRPVRDHDHITGVFRAKAHSFCNLKCKNQRSVKVVFHNLQNYDSHLFIKEIAKNGEQLDCIAQNDQKYISFTKHVKVDEKIKITKDENGEIIDKKIKDIKIQARFIDSYKFLLSSLSDMAEILEKEDLKMLSEFISNDEKKSYFEEKEFFHDYFSNYSVLEEKQLPPTSTKNSKN